MLPGAAANVGIERRPTRQHRTLSTPVVPRGCCRARGPQAPGAPPLRSGLPTKNTAAVATTGTTTTVRADHWCCPLPGPGWAVSHDHRQARTRLSPGGSARPAVIDVTGFRIIHTPAFVPMPDLSGPVSHPRSRRRSRPLSPRSACTFPLRSPRTARSGLDVILTTAAAHNAILTENLTAILTTVEDAHGQRPSPPRAEQTCRRHPRAHGSSAAVHGPPTRPWAALAVSLRPGAQRSQNRPRPDTGPTVTAAVTTPCAALQTVTAAVPPSASALRPPCRTAAHRRPSTPAVNAPDPSP